MNRIYKYIQKGTVQVEKVTERLIRDDVVLLYIETDSKVSKAVEISDEYSRGKLRLSLYWNHPHCKDTIIILTNYLAKDWIVFASGDNCRGDIPITLIRRNKNENNK